MISFAEQDIRNKGTYIELLKAVSRLSGLFSEGSTPFINYRAAENIFCRSFSAENLSRSDTAFDAKIGTLGIGLKTFTCPRGNSTEKIAEFNSLSQYLSQFRGIHLAQELARCRNQRIALAYELYGIERSVYHIVARKPHELLLFESDYDYINLDAISLRSSSSKSIAFVDGVNEYSFNFSKSTLYRKFYLPENAYSFPIEILDDPYQLLLDWFNKETNTHTTEDSRALSYVVLPLYSTSSKEQEVPRKSGLNQWNAGGRRRDYGEVYIPVPRQIHKYCPDFFPPRDQPFTLLTPRGESLSAKLCQEGSKALMTNPNNALSEWLLRRLFKLKEGELLTRERMILLGFDSVIVSKVDDMVYEIDVLPLNSYENFIKSFQD